VFGRRTFLHNKRKGDTNNCREQSGIDSEMNNRHPYYYRDDDDDDSTEEFYQYRLHDNNNNMKDQDHILNFLLQGSSNNEIYHPGSTTAAATMNERRSNAERTQNSYPTYINDEVDDFLEDGKLQTNNNYCHQTIMSSKRKEHDDKLSELIPEALDQRRQQQQNMMVHPNTSNILPIITSHHQQPRRKRSGIMLRKCTDVLF